MDTATLAVRFLILVPAHSAPAASIPHGENISSDAGQKYFKLLLLEE